MSLQLVASPTPVLNIYMGSHCMWGTPADMRELIGWYSYSFAAEPFIVSAVATYVPLFLEQLARKNAVWAVDLRTPCHDVPTDSPGLVPIPLPPPQCVVRVLWTFIDTSSLPLYTFSFSVLVQTLLVVSMSGVADRGAHRKRLLVGFAILGALSTIAMYGITTSHYYAAALLAVVANSSFGAVSVCGNAFLPFLVDQVADEEGRHAQAQFDRFGGACGDLEEVDTAKISAKISGRGVAIGYLAALLVQVITMFMLFKNQSSEDSTYMLQVVIALVGIWWLVFQIPVALYLPSIKQTRQSGFDSSTLLENMGFGWKSLWLTLLKVKEMRDIAVFLVGWFVISDAITTINSTAVLFARGNLQMATPALAGIGLLMVCFGVFGSLMVGRLKTTSPIQTIVVIALAAAVIPAYGILGFFSPVIGLKKPWEMYLLAAWYGVALGALNAMCRSVYGLMIPRGHETMFYALFAVTDKGSSVLGPTITGLITDKTHNIRYTFYFLLGMLFAAAYVFGQVDVPRGVEEARSIELQEERD